GPGCAARGRPARPSPGFSMSRRHGQPAGAGWGGGPAALAGRGEGRVPIGGGRLRAGDPSRSPLLIGLPGTFGQHRPEASCESPAASDPEGTVAAAVPVVPGRAGAVAVSFVRGAARK